MKASLATSTGPPYLTSPTLKLLRNLQCWFLSNLFPSSFAATLTLARSYFPNTELKPLNHLKLVLAFFVTSTCPTNVARPAWKLPKSLHFAFFNLLHISLQLLGHSQWCMRKAMCSKFYNYRTLQLPNTGEKSLNHLKLVLACLVTSTSNECCISCMDMAKKPAVFFQNSVKLLSSYLVTHNGSCERQITANLIITGPYNCPILNKNHWITSILWWLCLKYWLAQLPCSTSKTLNTPK